MDRLGKYYKMDDRDIRAYIGQESPENDSHSAKTSAFEYMRDQSNSYSYYAAYGNREYTVHKYNARWYFDLGHPMPESTTKSELTSWAMPKHYDGAAVSVGDGKVNWRGQPSCGNTGYAGINCDSSRSGAPTRNPNGGSGCNQNLGQRWTGELHYYMLNTNWDTYSYFCNGAQHSSANNFASRVWFRSPESNKQW